MNWRLASRLSVFVSAVLVITVLVVLWHRITNSAGPSLQGTDLGNASAPDFRLTD